MEHRQLGDSDLSVSAIALGSWLTYSGGVGREQTEACTRAAFDAGITFFDTANVYGRGTAETAWGEILADYPRDSFTLATKVFFPMGRRDRGLSRAQIHKQIEGALDRVQRVAAGQDPGRARPARRGEVRLQPAAVLDAVARPGGRGDPAVRAQRDLADRVVAARAGRAHR